MLKRIFSLVLIALVLTLVGCKASGTEDNNDEKLDSENSASEKEPVLVKELGTIGTEDDVFVEEEVDLSEYPKTVDLEDLSYTVDYFEQELMSNYSVYIREHPGNPKEGDFPTVDYVRPGDKVYAFEKAVVDGVTYYHVRKGNLVGWSIADDLVDYDGAKVSARRNNYGSPFANTTYAPNSVYISKVGIKDTTIHSFTLYGVQTENFDKAIKKEDSYLYVWGGTPYFDAFDGKSTHFVGDSTTLEDIEFADDIMITDEFGGAFNYEKVNTFEVDSQGIGIEDGKDYWNYIVSAGDEEKVIFQVTDDFETSKIYVFKFKE